MPKFHVEKSIIIDAPVEKVFEIVKDFNTQYLWSPWGHMEPDHKREVSGDGLSVGSIMSWDGKRIGSGELEHLEIKENKELIQGIRFTGPWKSQSDVRWTFEEVDSGTKATWMMDGNLPLFMFWMKKMMIAWVGMDYERGLSMLKQYTEEGRVDSKSEIVGLRQSEPQNYIGIRSSCAIPDVGPSMMEVFGQLKERPQLLTAPPFSIYHVFDFVKQHTEYTAAIPVDSLPETLPEGWTSGTLPDCEVLELEHTGKYEYLGNAWNMGGSELRVQKRKMKKGLLGWETYLNNPDETPDEQRKVRITVALR